MTAAQVPATISDVKLVNAFFRGRRTPEQQDDATCDAATMVRSKDTVNLFLKNASRLTSIEEAAQEGYSTASSGSSGSSGQAGATGKSSSSAESATLTSAQRQRHQQQQQQQQNSSSKYPNIDFLENDVSLWDAFFLRSKTSGRFQSVLRPSVPPPPAPPPALPVEEYLRFGPQSSRRVPIHDADSLRTLLPQAHRHLLAPSTATTTTTSTPAPSPLSQASQSMSKLQLRATNDDDNGAKQKWSPAGVVREAWPAVDDITSSPVPPIVVRRRRPSRRSSSANSTEQRNLNALNNNDENEEDDQDDVVAKRRSYHPQDFLSKVLTRSSHNGRKSDFPKVIYFVLSKLLNL